MFFHCLLTLATLALLFPLSALARAKNEHSLQLFDKVEVGHTQLQPGNYKVSWQGSGPSVQVHFQQYGKTIATAPATLKSNDSHVMQSDIVTEPQGNATMLKEIDFANQKEALLFHQSAKGM